MALTTIEVRSSVLIPPIQVILSSLVSLIHQKLGADGAAAIQLDLCVHNAVGHTDNYPQPPYRVVGIRKGHTTRPLRFLPLRDVVK